VHKALLHDEVDVRSYFVWSLQPAIAANQVVPFVFVAAGAQGAAA
jgi:hypothetical protein